MKKIEIDEYKKILLQILAYFDRLCRDNNINYSLIGGSLIGAVRNAGIIPWDDDVDVVLTNDNYRKLVKILKKNNSGRYKAYFPGDAGYYYPYIKIIDTKTTIKEKGLKEMPNNGVFLDVFRYNNVPSKKPIILYMAIRYYRSILAGIIENDEKDHSKYRIFKQIRSRVLSKRKPEKIVKKIVRLESKYNDKKTNYVLIDWFSYGINHEIQDKLATEEYIDVDFDNLKVMAFKKYDTILTTTFGDYMTPPPEDKRVLKHNIEAYWKK